MEQLAKSGWFINNRLVEDYFDAGVPKSLKEIENVLVNEDIRDYGEAIIVQNNWKEAKNFVTPCVLQLQKFRNVCVPKNHLGNPGSSESVFRIMLTDGHSTISALFLEPISGLNADTPPGTKIALVGSVICEGNFLMLKKSNVKIMGGMVEKLVEKWRIEKNSINTGDFKSKQPSNAPRWISFGMKGAAAQLKSVTKEFKANDVIQTVVKEKKEDEFSKNREKTLKDIDQKVKVFARTNVSVPEKPASLTAEQKIGKARPRKNESGGRNRNNSKSAEEFNSSKPSTTTTLFDFLSDVVPNEPTERHSSKRPEVNQRVPENSNRNNKIQNKREGYDSSRTPRHEKNPVRNIEKGMQKMSMQDNRRPNKPENQHNSARNDKRFNKRENNKNQNDVANSNMRSNNKRNNTRNNLVNTNQSYRASGTNSDSFPPIQANNCTGRQSFQVGSQCLAPWEDGCLYPATILNIFQNGQCIVRYDAYGNTMELPVGVLCYL